jgi:PIN domain nuclease of toxin-antitoxin system
VADWSRHDRDAFPLARARLEIRELPIGGEIALRARALAGVLVDPIDCFTAATALTHGGTLMTADTRLLDARPVGVLDARR